MEGAGRPGSSALSLWGWGGTEWDNPPDPAGGTSKWPAGCAGTECWLSGERGLVPGGQGGVSRPRKDPCPTYPACLQALPASAGLCVLT